MTVGTPLTDAGFADLLAAFQESWFKFEAQATYAITAERDHLQHYLDTGEVLPPDQAPWWAEWLSLVAGHVRQGRFIERVRILSEPPTSYQRYLVAVSPWHASAGEDIAWLSRSRATQLGLPLDRDWSLFDNKSVALTRFTPAGEVAGRELITDPEAIRHYRLLRDVAMWHAGEAEDIAAA